jgi:hypothetical protein
MSKSASMKPGASARNAATAQAMQPRFSNKLKIAMGAAVVIAALGGLIVAAKPGPVAKTPTAVELVKASAPNSAGRLVAEQMKFSFGPISMARGKVTHRYPIKNTGTEPLLIRKMYTSCMCTTVALVKNGRTSDAYGMPGHTPIPTINVPLNPKEEAFVEVVFDPAAHGPAGVGPIERVVTLENNAGRPLELEFAALVSP